jgi:cell division protein FtsI/penicillin-binding protein 2
MSAEATVSTSTPDATPVSRVSRVSPGARSAAVGTRGNGSVGSRPDASGRRADVVSLVVIGLIALGLVGLLARVVQLQLWPDEQLRAHMGDRTSRVVEPGRRGDILDRRGRVLAATRFGYRVVVDPEQFPRTDIEKHIVRISEATGVPTTEIGPKIVAAIARNDRIKNERAQQAKLQASAPQASVAARSAADAVDASEETPQGETGEANAGPEASPDASSNADAERSADGQEPKAAREQLVRYVVLTPGVLEESRIDAVKGLKVRGVHMELRPVREFADESLAAALMGVVGWDGKGAMAVEKLLDTKMQAKAGGLSYVRDSAGRPLWVEPGGWTPPASGQDVRLSIDLQLQAILYEELYRGVQDAEAQGGRGIILDPATGEVLAIADIVRKARDVVEYDWQTVIPKDKGLGGPRYRTVAADPQRLAHPALAHNRVVEDVYEPGSTFKPFMWSASTELGLVSAGEVFNTHWGQWRTPYGRHLADVVKREHMTWQEVLVNSSNIGMVQGTARMSFQQMREAVLKFGFGAKTGIGLPGETRGLVTPAKRWSNFTQTSVAIGHEVAVTPVQMARAFSVFTRPGEDAGSLPRVTLVALDESQRALSGAGASGEGSMGAMGSTGAIVSSQRVLPARVAALARETMRGVTAKLDENLARETGENAWRYELFGKSGTAEIPLGLPPPGKKRPRGSDGYFKGQYNSSFIAGGPVEQPRLVCLVVIDDPGPTMIAKKRHYGSWVAGPVVRRTMDRALSYLGVPASRTPQGNGQAHSGD